MIDLLELKKYVLPKLASDIEQAESGDQKQNKQNHYQTFIYGPIDILPSALIDFIPDETLAHFKNRESTFEILAVHPLEIFEQKKSFTRMLELTENNEDLYIVGGQRFDYTPREKDTHWEDFGEVYFFLPLLSFVRQNGQTFIHIHFSRKELLSKRPAQARFFILERLLSFNQRNDANFEIYDQTVIPNNLKWQAMINFCLKSLVSGFFDKVVLARKNILSFKTPPSPNMIYSKLAKNHPKDFNFLLLIRDAATFMSVTPERLFLLEDGEIAIDSLAGTRKRGQLPEEDLFLEQELLLAQKELREHRFVSEDIERKLQQVSIGPLIRSEEKILKLRHVQHLHTTFKAQAKKNTNFAQCINTFHPTPAVGGHPWPVARELIESLEPFSRGLYAGPCGVVGKKMSDFCVGIRSALLKNSELHIFAGAGIVEDSVANEEWIETGIKMKNFLNILEDQSISAEVALGPH